MFVGGISFALLYKFAKGERKAFFSNDVLKLYFYFIGGAALIAGAIFVANGGGKDSVDLFVKGAFEIISAATSTGFNAMNFENQGFFVVALVLIVMVFGSCAGSTCGGAKLDRLLLMLKCVNAEIYRVLHPNSIEVIRVNGRPVTAEAFNKASAFLAIYGMVIVACWLVFAASGLPAYDSLFNAVSMISNIGYGYGVTGYGGSFADLNEVCKVVGALVMLIGRLEMFTILVLFTRGFWKK